MVEAVVDFDYVAQEADELTIRKGDILRNIQMRPGGWWEGSLSDKRGMFPDNFVHILTKESNADVVLRNKPRETRQCQAIFSYSPEHEDELRLNVGDIIEVLGEIEDGWWRGRLGDKEGVFPSNFVQEAVLSSAPMCGVKKSKLGSKDDLTNLMGVVESEPHVPSLPPKPAKILCQALFAYDACNDDELTLKVGDIITLISKDGQDKGWWRGELRGHIGVFPDNFVTLLKVGKPAYGGSEVDLMAIPLDAAPFDETNKKTERPQAVKSSTPPAVTKAAIRKDQPKLPAGTVALQRKSLELNAKQDGGPPIPGKKPAVPIKKSPSLTSSGIFSGLKQKVLGHDHRHSDNIDGNSSSRVQPPREDLPPQQIVDDHRDEFDRVERSSMLVDPRANRAKAPGRRPPRMVIRDSDPALTNGNLEHAGGVPPSPITPVPDDTGEPECKPKPRDWEIHRAPWMDELKLNQAKKTSPLNPSPESAISRLKFNAPLENSRLNLSSEKLDSPDETNHTETPKSRAAVFEKESDMSKSMSAISSRLRTVTPDQTDVQKPGISLRNRSSLNQPASLVTPVRPQSIHGETTMTAAVTNNEHNSSRISPGVIRNSTPSPILKPPTGPAPDLHNKAMGDKKSADHCNGTVSMRQYMELEEKVTHLECALEKQGQAFQARLDELTRKLQYEIDLRQQLQYEVDKLAQCVTQV